MSLLKNLKKRFHNFIFVFTILLGLNCQIYGEKGVTTGSEYEVIMEDGDMESTIKKPFELTAEEEKLLKGGICKIVHNEPNDPVTNAVFKRNELVLAKIEKNLYLYILGESLKDYGAKLDKEVTEKKIEITSDERDAIDSAQRIHCDLGDLKDIYDILVTMPDTYAGLNPEGNSSHWENFVVIQLDRIYDYVNTHFSMFKKELLRLKNTKAYYERKNFYRKKEGKAELMTLFYDWLETTVCKSKRMDEFQIRLRLNTHLKWVVSLPVGSK